MLDSSPLEMLKTGCYTKCKRVAIELEIISGARVLEELVSRFPDGEEIADKYRAACA
ncbi:hypothetical protein J6590_025296 [Homalodisca vitripennis]|nr:hypothetical protein J6590_025296 [Homalodisca vitripennis]